jgi:hypothetical protein
VADAQLNYQSQLFTVTACRLWMANVAKLHRASLSTLQIRAHKIAAAQQKLRENACPQTLDAAPMLQNGSGHNAVSPLLHSERYGVLRSAVDELTAWNEGPFNQSS